MTDEHPDDSAAPRTVEDLLVQQLRRLGVRRTYGFALEGLDHVPVVDPDLAVLLADADGRLGHEDGSGRLGAATLAGQILHLSSAPGGTAPVQTVGSVDELVEVLARPPGMEVPGTSAVHLDLDLHEPVPEAPFVEAAVAGPTPLVLDPALAGLQILVLAGPGVSRSFSHDGLRALTRASGARVLATFGALGLLRWDSPYHAGVGGLQEHDLRLGGLDDADVVVTTGLDDVEVTPERRSGLVAVDVAPRMLEVLCRSWSTHPAPAAGPSVRASLLPVLGPLWEDSAAPLSAARAALHLSGALPEHGVVVADPGPVGFWIARAAPTSQPGAICVPATAEPGFAAAAALVASIERRPVLAVTDEAGVGCEATAAILDLARVLDVPVGLQVWGPSGAALDADRHARLVEDLVSGVWSGVRIEPVAVDLGVPASLVEVAGPVTAWSGAGFSMPSRST